MSWVRVKDSHGNEHLVTTAALNSTFAGHGFVVIDKAKAPKKSAKKTAASQNAGTAEQEK